MARPTSCVVSLSESPDSSDGHRRRSPRTAQRLLELVQRSFLAALAERSERLLVALGLEIFPTQPNTALTVAKMPGSLDSSTLLSKLEKQYGLKLANGQDNLKGKIIRLAHMGYIDQFDILAAIAGIELVLLEMGHAIEPGVGVAAAQRVFARKS